jgi:hypothetical protein
MSFNLMAELSAGADWEGLEQEVKPLLSLVEVFPIPRGVAASTDALGISVPARAANGHAWTELAELLRLLTTKRQATVTEMYSGKRVDPSSLDELRHRFLGK